MKKRLFISGLVMVILLIWAGVALADEKDRDKEDRDSEDIIIQVMGTTTTTMDPSSIIVTVYDEDDEDEDADDEDEEDDKGQGWQAKVQERAQERIEKAEEKAAHMQEKAAEMVQKAQSKALSEQEKAQMRMRKLEERIRVRGKNVDFGEAPPVLKDGRTLIPVRAVLNGLQAQVDWDEATRTVTITRDDTVIKLVLGSISVTVNGQEVQLDVPAQTISNRTFVPLRFIAQTLGDKVQYDEEIGDISIGEDGATQSDQEETQDQTTVQQ